VKKADLKDIVDLNDPRMTADNAKKVAVKEVVPEPVEEKTNKTEISTKGEFRDEKIIEKKDAKTKEKKDDKSAPKSDALLAIGNNETA